MKLHATFKKILKWAGLILLFLIMGITLTVMGRQNIKYDRPYPTITASTDTAIIMRGKHLVFEPGIAPIATVKPIPILY